MCPSVPVRGTRGSPAHGRRAGCGDGLSVLDRAVWFGQVAADPHLQGGPEVSVGSWRWQAQGPLSHLIPYCSVLLSSCPLTRCLDDYESFPPLLFPAFSLAKILTFRRGSHARLCFPFCPMCTPVPLSRADASTGAWHIVDAQ